MIDTGSDQNSTPIMIPADAVCILAILTGLVTWQFGQCMSLGSGASTVSNVSTLCDSVLAFAMATVWRFVNVTKPVEDMVRAKTLSTTTDWNLSLTLLISLCRKSTPSLLMARRKQDLCCAGDV